MTWKTVTTVILDCPPNPAIKDFPHTTYYRVLPAPKAGTIVTCPYCETPAIVKATTVTHRSYQGKHRGHIHTYPLDTKGYQGAHRGIR